MAYLPLARKYRPQTFEELVGQSHVTETLTRALTGKRVAQAYLFTGQRGVGKTSAARILAKCLNCERGPSPKPCNRCSRCEEITQGRSLDVIEIDGASNRGIDEIRALRETVPFAPVGGAFRVYIIDEVHMLTAEAFNALLKTLEEPPAHVKFIFATTAANKVPATILSRCQRFDFRRLEAATIVEALTRVTKTEKITLEEPACYAVARAAEGSLRDAEVILEQLASFVEGPIREADVTELLGVVASEALIEWTQAILDRDSVQALARLTSQLERGKDPVQLLTSLIQQVRNLLIIRSSESAEGGEAVVSRLIDEPAERLTRLRQQAAHATPQELLLILQVLTGAYELVRRSPMAQTILELVVIKLATREAWQSLDAISQRLEQLAVGAPPQAAKSIASVPPPPVRQPATPTPELMNDAPEVLQSLWPEFLRRLGEQKMSLAAYLAESRPVRFEQQVVTIGLPGFALHQEVLTAVEPRRLIERLLSELCQTAVTVEYAVLPEPAAGEAGAVEEGAGTEDAPPIVQDIVKLFNATVIDQPRST
jgi:DNA polymerase-3 subunit gamma/tau